MLLSQQANSFESPLTPKIKLEYSDLQVISEETSYVTYIAKNRNTEQLHTIRALNTSSAFIKEGYDLAATLFIQELLRLCTSSPNDVLIETFEISENKISYATLPYTNLKGQLDKTEHIQTGVNVDKLIKNVVSDVEFLVKSLKLKNCYSIITLENIYQLKESGNFFLGDWAKIIKDYQSKAVASTDPVVVYQNQSVTNISEEIYHLGLVLLELYGLKKEELESLKAMRDTNPFYEITLAGLTKEKVHLPDNLRELLMRMLNKTANQRPNLEEFKRRSSLSFVEDEEEKTIIDSGSIGEFKTSLNYPLPKLLMWCSRTTNKITIYEPEAQQIYASFDGVKLLGRKEDDYSWTHIKEIPSSNLIVSLHHSRDKCAKFEIFDISKREVQKVFSFEEVEGIVGVGDFTYNKNRKLMALIPQSGKTAYHLFYADPFSSTPFSLKRRAKWHSHYNTRGYLSGFDFDMEGKRMATIDTFGMFVLSEVDNDKCVFHKKIFGKEDKVSLCRWNPITGDRTVFVKHDWNKLDLLDTEKKVLLTKEPVQLQKEDTAWIDVRYEGNLLASTGQECSVKIFDRRQTKVVRTLDHIHHKDYINCVRWSANGFVLTTAARDNTVRLIDFGTGKVIHAGTTFDESIHILI